MAPNPAEQREADDNNTQQLVKEGMINTKQEHDCGINTPALVFSLFLSRPLHTSIFEWARQVTNKVTFPAYRWTLSDEQMC